MILTATNFAATYAVMWCLTELWGNWAAVRSSARKRLHFEDAMARVAARLGGRFVWDGNVATFLLHSPEHELADHFERTPHA